MSTRVGTVPSVDTAAGPIDVAEGVDSRTSIVWQEMVNGCQVVRLELSEDDRQVLMRHQEEFKPVFDEFLNPERDKTFYLSQEAYRAMQEMIRVYFAAAAPLIERGDDLADWELKGIGAILGKALIPDSLRPTVENARRLAQDVERFCREGGDLIALRELCTGAGLSTIMTWMEVTRVTDSKTTLVTTDNTVESIVTSSMLLSLYNIPHVIVSGAVPDGLLDYDGVVLQYWEVGEALKDEAERGIKYTGLFSDHGISYFAHKKHDDVVRNAVSLLGDGGFLYICALEPDVAVELSQFSMAAAIIRGGNRKRFAKLRAVRETEFKRHNGPEANVNYDIGRSADGRPAFRRFYTPEAAGLYDMLHWEGVLGTIRYISIIKDVAQATKELGGEVQSPVSYSADLVRSLVTDGAVVEITPPLESGISVARTLRVQVGRNNEA